MSVIVDVIINTDQAEQQLQALQQQIASDLAQGAARIGTTAGQAATATARAAGKNATEEFLRAFDPDKLKAELQSAGLDEQQIEIILDTTAAKAETQKLKDSIAGALSGATGLAEDRLKQITAQVAREVDRAAGKVKSVTEIVDGVRDLKTEIQGLGQAGDAASKGIGQLVLNESVDKFGDLKDIFEKTGVALLGMSESAVEAGVRMADIAEKGAMIGAAFGPTGAAIGLVAGGILGAFNESARAAAERAKELSEEIAKQRGVLESLQAELARTGNSVGALTSLQAKLAIEQEKAAAMEAERSKAADLAAAAYDAQEAALGRLSTSMYQNEKTGLQFLGTSRKAEAARRDLAAAEEALAEATKLANEQQALAAELSFKLAAATAKEIKTVEEQFDVLINGSKLSKLSAQQLNEKYLDLQDTFKANKKWTDKTAQSAFDAKNTEAQLTAGLEEQKEVVQELNEVKAELERRELKSTKATGASTKATKEDTKAKEASLKPLAKQLTDFDKLIALEKEHEAFLARQKQTAAEGLFGQDYLTQGIADAAEAMGKQTEDLLQMIELDGRTVSEKVQDDIDALRKFKEEAAAELAKQAKVKYLKDVADAEAMAMEANVAAYMQILQPYSAFIGGIFNQFAEAIASGQSATEAFAESAKSAIAGILGALAKEFGARSLAAFAAGFSAAAIGNPVSAVAFYKSGAAYAAAAAAAGLGSAVVSSAGASSAPSVGGGAGISASSGGVGGTSNSLGGSSQQSNSTPGSIVVDLRGAVFPTSDLTGAQQFGEAVARSLAAASAGNQPMARRLIGPRGFVV